MTKLELSPDGYERIMKNIRSLEDVINREFFNPGVPCRYLGTLRGGLRELRQTLHEVCLLVPDAADSPGPGAA